MVDFPEYPNVLIRSRLLGRARPWLYSPARSAYRSPPAAPSACSDARAHCRLSDLMRLLLARSLARAHTWMDTRTVLNNCIKEPHSHLAVFVIEREGLARLDFIQNYGVQVRGPALLQLHRFAGGCDPSAHLLPLQHPQVAASRLVQVPR